MAEAGKAVKSKASQTRQVRETLDHTAALHYSLIDTWFPSKYGLSYTYSPTASGSWELEWSHSSIKLDAILDDVAKASEDRVLLMYKSYSSRNSFYWTYGVNYQKLKIYLGSDLLNSVPALQIPSVDALNISTLGLTWGLGNRWQWDNWMVGIDWFQLHLPIITLNSQSDVLNYATDANDRDNIKTALDVFKHLPTLTAFKVAVGYSF